jgi:hypothetical protein
MHPAEWEVPYDDVVILKVQLFSAKPGHKFPTGSVEDRIVWLHVTDTDAEGKTYHLPVDRKASKVRNIPSHRMSWPIRIWAVHHMFRIFLACTGWGTAG